MELKELINEWFFRSPKGYVMPPYSDSELKILIGILKENNISNWKDYVNYFSQLKEVEQVEDSSEETSATQPELESNDDFRNVLNSVEKFREVIVRRYFPAGFDVDGLDNLYQSIMEQPETIQNGIRRIIAKKSNRDFNNGTFKMGQYEKILYDLVKQTITIDNSTPELLWLAFLFDSEPMIHIENGEPGNLKSSLGNAWFHRFSQEAVSIGTINIDLNSILTVLKQIGETIFEISFENYDSKSINKVIEELSDPSSLEDIKMVISKAEVTKLAPMKNLSALIKQALGDHDVNQLPLMFKDTFNRCIAAALAKCPYYGTISGDMVYLMHSKEIYPQINATKQYKLNEYVYNLDNHINIDGNIINSKLMG